MNHSTPGLLSITDSQSSLKLMSTESVMPSNHLILCHPLLLPSSVFPSIRVFSNESALHIRWPKYGSFSFNISPSNEHPGVKSLRMDFPSIRIFFYESALHIQWPKYWSVSFSISPSSEYSGMISLLSKELSEVFSSTTV